MKTKEMLVHIGSARLFIAAGRMEEAEGILHSLQSALRIQLKDEEDEQPLTSSYTNGNFVPIPPAVVYSSRQNSREGRS